MNLRTLIRYLIASVFVLATGAAFAEDIDIFSGNTSVTPGTPNVLIVLDNTANWSQSFDSTTKFAAEKAALAAVITNLIAKKAPINIGLMLFTETGSPNTNTDGGYVRFAIQPIIDSNGNATNAANCLLTMLGQTPTPACTGSNITYYTNLDILNDKSNGGKGGVTMGEAYDYYAGANAYAGNNKIKADPRAFVSQTIAGPQYLSPVVTGTCAKNFIIVINNGPFSDNQSDTSTATSQLSAVGGTTAATVINPPDDGTSNNNEADEWTRYLNKASNVQAITYTLEIGPQTNGGGPYNTSLLQSMGTQGQGGYFAAADSITLDNDLTRIFNDIQAVNSVFASSSLPLSADNTGNFANQVYMAVFRPDGSGQPRWMGNLKQYQFAVDSNRTLYLADANGAPAAGSSGFATPDAVSFWTSKDTTKAPDAPASASTSASNGSTGGFWFFDRKGSGGSYDSPDGEWVEKGGAAEQLRLAYLGYGARGGIGDTNASTLNGFAARKVYTCTGSCLTTSGSLLSGTPFDSTNSDVTADPATFKINPQPVTVSNISSDRVVSTITSGTALSAGTISLSATSTLATITTQQNHKLANGIYVTVNGSSVSGTNGTFQITTTSNKSFTYVVSGVTPGTSSTSPTVTTASTTVTVNTSTTHGFPSGSSVVIAGASCPPMSAGDASTSACPYNGTFTIGAAFGSSFQITLASPGVGASATGTTITASGTVARVTTASAHGFSLGDSVTIANASCSTDCSAYNITANITNIPTTTSFDYAYSASSPLPVANNSTITAVDNTPAASTLASLIKWVRGQDTQNENGFQVNGTNTDVRPSIHGDILHSRPVVLNYASGTTDNVYLFYGGNDGVFRAVKGGQAATDGREQWAFIPQEFFPILKRQYDNNPLVLYPSTPSGLGATHRDYGFDGPITSYIERNSSGVVQKAYLYIGVRRGGRFIYALDVTSPTTPKFLWRKGCTTSGTTTTCDTGFSELAQTWSAPQVIKVQANTNPVLIFGGGYDAASEDAEPPPMTDTVGRIVYVVDAFTGNLIWSAGNSAATPTLSVSGMDFSVPADILAVDRHQTGYVDRAYFADVGGNMWRIDLGGTTTSTWQVWKIASVGGRTASSAGRKFFFAPDVVFGTLGTFDAVVIGSGDREHPLANNAASSIPNRVYMFVDSNTGTTGSNLNITESDLFDATDTTQTVSLTNHKGWFVTLRDGEQVINGPIVVASQMVFGTNQPCASGKLDDNGNCSATGTNLSCTGNLGIARRYDINFLTAAAGGYTDSSNTLTRSEVAAGGGFLPSPVAGVVEINGTNYPFITDNPLSPGGVLNPGINVSSKRFRTYWHELLE